MPEMKVLAPGELYESDLVKVENAVSSAGVGVCLDRRTPMLNRLSVDSMFGQMDFYLYASWLYDKPLDAAAIKATMTKLVTKMPVLAGRRVGYSDVRDGFVLNNAGARFSSCAGRAGSAAAIAKDSAHAERYTLVDCPISCAGGTEPIFTVRVTNFADGTSAIGISMPHSLVDGKGYYAIVAAFAAAHNHGTLDVLGEFDFDSARVWKSAASCVAAARSRGGASMEIASL